MSRAKKIIEELSDSAKKSIKAKRAAIEAKLNKIRSDLDKAEVVFNKEEDNLKKVRDSIGGKIIIKGKRAKEAGNKEAEAQAKEEWKTFTNGLYKQAKDKHTKARNVTIKLRKEKTKILKDLERIKNRL